MNLTEKIKEIKQKLINKTKEAKKSRDFNNDMNSNYFYCYFVCLFFIFKWK